MKRFTKRSPRGFTLVELLVVIGIIALLISILLPSLNKARELSNRIKCSANLRSIGQCLAIYANENGHIYPRTAYSLTNADAPSVDNSGLNSSDPFHDPGGAAIFDPGGVGIDNVPSALFWLARSENMQLGSFICPSGDAVVETLTDNIQNHANFASVPGSPTGTSGNLSYSFENPYPNAAAVNDGWKWNDTVPSDYALAADLNPGNKGTQDPTVLDTNSSAKDLTGGNTLNHRTVGENVLFADGHVDFYFQPLVGVGRDCIYSVGGARDTTTHLCPVQASPTKVIGSPGSRDDSILLPTLTQ